MVTALLRSRGLDDGGVIEVQRTSDGGILRCRRPEVLLWFRGPDDGGVIEVQTELCTD